MKKSELRQIIREEIATELAESLRIGSGFNREAEQHMIRKWTGPTGLRITAANGRMDDRHLDFRIHLSQGDVIRVKGPADRAPKISVTTDTGQVTSLSWDRFADTIYGHSDSLIYDLLLFWEDQYWQIRR